MALLPTTPGILLSSEATPIGAALVDQDDAGSVRVRSMFAGRSLYFIRRYDFITSAQVTTLRTFYTDNRTISFTHEWLDGVTYTCVFVDEGAFFDLRRGTDWFGHMKMAMTGPI